MKEINDDEASTDTGSYKFFKPFAMSFAILDKNSCCLGVSPRITCNNSDSSKLKDSPVVSDACLLPLPVINHSGSTPKALAMGCKFLAEGFFEMPRSILEMATSLTPTFFASAAWLNFKDFRQAKIRCPICIRKNYGLESIINTKLRFTFINHGLVFAS